MTTTRHRVVVNGVRRRVSRNDQFLGVANTQPAAGSPRQLVSSPADRDRRRRGSRILRPGYRCTENRVVADSRTAPAVGTVTADTPLSPSPRSAVPAGTTFRAGGGTTGATRCPSEALGLQVIAARAGRSTSRERGRPRGRGLGRRSTLRSTSRPRPPPPALAARPGRPRAARVPRRRLRRSVAAVAWQPHRPPPRDGC